MAQAGLEARAAAVKLMCAVTEEGALLSAAAPGILAKLDPADRARAQRLATEKSHECDDLAQTSAASRPFSSHEPTPTAPSC